MSIIFDAIPNIFFQTNWCALAQTPICTFKSTCIFFLCFLHIFFVRFLSAHKSFLSRYTEKTSLELIDPEEDDDHHYDEHDDDHYDHDNDHDHSHKAAE